MNEKLNERFFGFISNLAQINNKELLIRHYINALNDSFIECKFVWLNEASECNCFEISIDNKVFGFILFDGNLNEENQKLLKMSVRLVAIFMFRLDQMEMQKHSKSNAELIGEAVLHSHVEEKNELVDKVINSLSDTFYLFDPYLGKAVKWNTSLEKVSGYSNDEIAVLPTPEGFYAPEEIERINSSVEEVLKTGSGNIELNLVCKDGTLVPTEYVMSVIYDSVGEIKYIVSIGRDISERKRTLKALEKSETKLRNIVEHSNEMFYIHDLDNKLNYISPQSMDLLGYDTKEMLIKWTDLLTDNPMNDAGVNNTQKAIETGHRQSRYTLELFKKDQHRIYVEVDESPLKDKNGTVIGIVGALRDISKQWISEKKIKHSQQRLDISLEANNASVFEEHLISGKTIFTPQLFVSLGYSEKEIPNTTEEYRSLVHPDDVHFIDESLSQYINKFVPYYYCQYRFLDKEGDWRWMASQGKILALNSDGSPKILVGIMQDVNFNKVAELAIMDQNDEIANQNEEYQVLTEELQRSLKQIQDINIELEIATDKAEESDRLKSAFLANMSHEIRTPLNAILGFSNLIATQDISSGEQLQFSRLIENGGNHLLRIIDDLIDISKIESNQLIIHKEEFKLAGLFDEIEKTFELEQHNKSKGHVNLSCQRPKKIHQITLFSDPIRIRQVFINLLSNSFKFTDSGSVEFGVEKVKKKCIVFFVKDTGIGIDKGSLDLIFDRFMQGKSNGLREGTGLGLSITKGLVEILGGEIWVESKEGKGSLFRFTIPLV